jgi:hypothetical protein
MKTLSIMLGLLLIAPNLAWGRQRSVQLPINVRSALNKRFRNWKFAAVDSDIRKFLRENVSADARPEIIEGDFDGNGKSDYAVYIVHGKDSRRMLTAVALMRKRARVEVHILDSGIPSPKPVSFSSGLVLAKKGVEAYDYHTDRKFRYRHDAIILSDFEKAGVSYIYENGRFRSIVTSD